MKDFMSTFLVFIFIFIAHSANSQSYPCNYWSAPCPNATSISQADEWEVRKGNGAIEQGLAFQRKMRNEITDFLQKTAKQNGWLVYQLTDEYNDGPPFIFISYANWEATPYEKRPPTEDHLAFIIVVNKDSLMLWRQWKEEWIHRMEKSVNEQDMDALQKEDLKNTTAFTEGTIVLVHFGINPYHVTTGMEDGGQHSLIPQSTLQVPGAFYAGLLINKEPPDRHAYELTYKGYFFNSPASVATILFGNYQPKDSYNNWQPMFEKPFTSSAATLNGVKSIKCDVLQNLCAHIEGRPDKVKDVINKINWNDINSMMGK
ncbi:MAG: hypothetical protein EKK39_11865 [Sphingobacteriales bacterium]|uniref:hypothetical protein n=1 Tax=Hydrotalea flava TaxID=714549 RepID=UPI00082B1AA8|nr:hypothetical protein [Hydrotalea flava]RTL48833.1 MAG: hypothetical protein EKK39_11865 [Sphingobacteriales bacterium]